MFPINDEVCNQLTIACSVIGGIFALNLILVMHNVYRYLWKLKITKNLILLFYIFVTINCVGNIVEFFLKADDP